MRKFTPRSRWFLLLLTLLLIGRVHAQKRPMTVVYGENKRPSHIEREIIVRFDPVALRFINIDNPAFQAGLLNNFIDDKTLEQVSQALGYNAAGVEVFKIFGAMTSADTLSIDRMGETIRLDDHWASFVLQLPIGSDEQAVCKNLDGLFPLVRYAHLNWVFEIDDTRRPLPCPTGIPNDPEYLSRQGSLYPTASYPNGHINAEPAWKVQTGRNSIRVGVVDSGIDAAHPDLNNGSTFGPVVTSGYDFSNNLPRLFAQDKTGHGTACAGIIGAQRNNTSGIAGIAGGDGNLYGVQLADMKIFQLASAPISTIVRAWVEGSVHAAPSSGYGYALHVMNNSFSGYLIGTQPPTGGTFTAPQITELRNAVRTVYRNKVTMVCSRGNLNVTTASFPNSFPDDWVLSVGASDESGNKASFSNFGQNVDLIAPGVSSLVYTTQSQQKQNASGGSTVTGLYQTFNGTSAATPHVSGVAALLLSSLNSTTSPQNNLAPEDVEQLLQRSAKDRGTINAAAPYDDQTGWGLLDVGNALYKSRRGPYRIVHDRLTSSSSVVSNNVSIQLLSAYVSGATTLAAGQYIADRYRVTGTFSPRTSLVSPDEQILRVWARNSSTNLWSGSNPVEAEAGVRVVSWNQNSVVAEGYTYFIKRDLAGRAVNRWAPYDPANTSQGIMDVTYYTYNSFSDLPYFCREANDPLTDPVPSAHPNPAAEDVTIEYTLPAETRTMRVEVLNMSGQVVHRQEVSAQGAGARRVTVPLQGLASGFYVFRLISETGVQIGKFIKQ